jgi:processive 1,2-diacylglycerol beta-glucosyltransferase
LRLLQPAKETIVVDFMEWTHPFIDPFSRYVFAKTVKTFPSVYGYVFRKTRDSTFSSLPKILNPLGVRRLSRLLKEMELSRGSDAG